ncbi:MAG: hypothetical protein FGM24_04480 [Candidatus Kapabacteria bacterium]|nr:hypothetical protein [Candidatus Kapabacteria bacterium]
MDGLTCGCHRISQKTRARLVYVLDTLACRDLAPADAARSMRITPKVLHRLVMVLRYRFMVPVRYSSSRRAYVRLREEHRDAALLLAGRIISDDRRYTHYHFHDATEYFTV